MTFEQWGQRSYLCTYPSNLKGYLIHNLQHSEKSLCNKKGRPALYSDSHEFARKNTAKIINTKANYRKIIKAIHSLIDSYLKSRLCISGTQIHLKGDYL